ncbi:MAG: aldehyde dehydrogenase family protein [Akkermansiaceae bacterium]
MQAVETENLASLKESQRAYFDSGETRDFSYRKSALQRLENVLVKHRDEMLEALDKDLGKPGVEAYLAEYYFLLQELRLIRKSMVKWLKSRKAKSPVYFLPCSSQLRRDPYGRVLILAPWNYPLQLSLSPLIAAVAAGNTVVLKPSEMAPACEQLLVRILGEAFAPEHVAVVTGNADVANELMDQAFDFVFFTGSTHVGKKVAAKAAHSLTPNIMELGGKCPCVVDASVKVEVAAQRILTGKFFNGGQTCFAPDYVVVAPEMEGELLEAMQRILSQTPWDREMARVVNERHYARLAGLIPESAIKFGEDDELELRLAPRLLPNVSWEDEVMQSEIFGPLLPVLTYTDYEDLLSHLRSYGSPLALYIFSQDVDMQERLMRDIASGGVCINDTMKQGSNLDIPFGGVGDSGYGRYRGKAGVHAFSYERAVVKKPIWGPDWFELTPPYGDKLNWLKRFLR